MTATTAARSQPGRRRPGGVGGEAGAWVGGDGGAGGVDAWVGVGIRVVGVSGSLIGDEVYGTAADVLAG
jgi:hypothetical protein